MAAVGQRLSFDGAPCTVRYVGPVAGASAGVWLGVEWDVAGRGKHDGVHQGVRYFACRRQGPEAARAASFVRPTRPADRTRSFLAAVRDKYAADDGAKTRPVLRFSGKVAEEVGFDKVRRQMAQLETLRVVLVDGMCVDRAGSEDEAADDKDGEAAIRTTCPSITELDLSRNLFVSAQTVAAICRQLPALRGLRLDGNRFAVDLPDDLPDDTPFAGIRELSVAETLLAWPDIGRLAAHFPDLVALTAGGNQLDALPPLLVPTASLPLSLTTVSLEYNTFGSLAAIASLAVLPALRNLHLKGGHIARVDTTAVFAPSLRYVDLAYNRIADWAFVDALPAVFPGLASLRLAHNPVYDVPGAAFSSTSTSTSTSASALSEESYMLTVGRLAALHTLNFSTIAPADRANAEMFYLSRIARQMAAVPPGAPEAAVAASHPRYGDLCARYGTPAIVRRVDVNPAFLEARLMAVLFAHGAAQHAVQIPRAWDLYAVRGLVGRLVGAAPHTLRLVWETGEWDPVAGLDDGDGDGDEDLDEGEAEAAERAAEQTAEDVDDVTAEVTNTTNTRQAGRWVKREVELKDSPRQLGFCVDGVQARIRVEVR